MTFDDDDVLPSQSGEDYFTKSDHGKSERLKRKLKTMFGLSKKSELQKTTLQSKLNLKSLKDALTGRKDEKTKRETQRREKQKKQSTAPKTQTLKEKETLQVQTAQERPSTDSLIEKQNENNISDEETQTQPG